MAIPAYGSKVIVDLNQRSLVRQVKRAMRDLGFSNVVNMVFNPAAGMIAGRLGESELIYYCVDEYTAFTGSAEARESILKMVPMQVEGTAWDIAHGAVYLASDESRWVTGVMLPIDGGLVALRAWPR